MRVRKKNKPSPLNDWRADIIAILVFVSIATMSGYLSGYWTSSFLVAIVVLFAWKSVDFVRFYLWYKGGASSKAKLIKRGVFGALTELVLSHHRKADKIRRRNKSLLQQFNTTAQAVPFATVIINENHEIKWINRSAGPVLNINENDKNEQIDNIIRSPKFVAMLNKSKKDQGTKLNHPNEPDKKIHLRLIKLNRKRSLIVARDISQQEALQKSRKAFFANASHELRTPLTVISGYLEMIQSSAQIPDEWAVAIDQALIQSNRMEHIIGDMLKLSSIEHDRFMERNHQLIDMPQLLNDIFNNIKNSSNAKQHLFSAQIDSTLKIEGNESEIAGVCMNLLRNAVIHTPPKTAVKLLWFVEDHAACLWVADDGEGIDAKHIPHLTERFYRIDNSRSQNIQSTGLGLAIVKHICFKHGADFEIDSEPNQGSCFKIKFPSGITKIESP